MIGGAAELRSEAGTHLALAGVGWDAIKVSSRFLALRAIENLGNPGAITVDPRPAASVLYFLVPAGTAADWRMPQTTAFGRTMHVVLPPDHKQTPPGPYWLVQRAQGVTQAAELRQALEEAADPTAPGEPGVGSAGQNSDLACASRELWLPHGPLVRLPLGGASEGQ
ncbi:hypothetical protein OG895_43285 [Streptomyces sp. NBC_00201]|uniref:hypothetical protein n=1 Tax=unclassified Streptomyces TaxID=2593676 RepID=UPI0022567EA1|nr:MULTISPECIES: hypothetical protein [unclassified Streptomyces]MCX5063720.1 hypothetical protein [Streptomyces sp. NBC_00452]MCX5251875.1 hypothetical protein [Streptomyces sp. NBC_00201]MCX5294222.1 hypothetical protein [Streptomyces sp. NBC_00183]